MPLGTFMKQETNVQDSVKEDSILTEDLILRSLSKTGYLKFPEKFADRFSLNANVAEGNLPNPLARIREMNGTIQLIFEWGIEEGSLRPAKLK